MEVLVVWVRSAIGILTSTTGPDTASENEVLHSLVFLKRVVDHTTVDPVLRIVGQVYCVTRVVV